MKIHYRPSGAGKLRLLVTVLMSMHQLKGMGFNDKDLDDVGLQTEDVAKIPFFFLSSECWIPTVYIWRLISGEGHFCGHEPLPPRRYIPRLRPAPSSRYFIIQERHFVLEEQENHGRALDKVCLFDPF